MVAIAFDTSFAFAGVTNPEVPEPTAMLVWAGLAGIGGLFFYRRNRETD
jgi:LPXTG-motif cell wall-anchored protein